MKIHRPLLLIVLAVLLAASASSPASGAGGAGGAGSTDVDGIVSMLQNKYENVITLVADFSQVSKDAFETRQVSEGKVYFKKPGMMKWLYFIPVRDELVSNGSTVWFYQPDLNQVVVSPFELGASTLATNFLSGMGDLKREFSIKLLGEEKGAYSLELTSVEDHQGLKRLILHVDKESWLVVRTEVEDHFGNRTTVSFSHMETNNPIKDTFFEFDLPEGVNIVRP